MIKYIFIFLFSGSINNYSVNAQERKLLYDIMKGDNVIGSITFIELSKDQKKFLSFTSNVKTRFILSYCDYASETAAFEDGVMVYSSFYQKTNGSEKANKTTIAAGKSYKLIDGKITKVIEHYPIRYNMLLLYNTVPENINQVYSDNFQKLLDIKKVADNKYRLALPDGNYNYYSYKNGVCTEVKIERTLVTVKFVLKQII